MSIRYQFTDHELELIIEFYRLPPAHQDELRRRWNLAGVKASHTPKLDQWRWLAWATAKELADDALAALFTGTKNAAPVVTKGAPPPQPAVVVAAARAGSTRAVPGKVTPDLQGPASHYNRALQALRHGDWTQFADEMHKLGQNLGQPDESMHH
jgi:hypothetical protein